jgi:hypothetical protein
MLIKNKQFFNYKKTNVFLIKTDVFLIKTDVFLIKTDVF